MALPRPGRTRRLITALAGLALLAGGLVTVTDSAEAATTSRYLVQTSSSALGRPLAKARQGGGTVVTRFEHVLNGFTADLTAAQAVRLAADSSVISVVKDEKFTVRDEITSSATQVSPPWSLDRIDQRTATLDGRYDYTSTGWSSTVFVVDSGVRLGHSQFGGRASSGRDFVDGGAATDCAGHGTHVAGTVGGRTYGVAKSAKIVSVRVLDCNGDTYPSTLISALDWIVDHKPAGPSVVNLSLGAPSTISGASAVDRAAAATVRAGIPVVAAAGNYDMSACGFSPARVPSVITVAASDSDDYRAEFSDYGSCVDLYAPGVNIRSASNASNSATELMDGTSMAAPQVSGAVARIQQDNPLASPATIAAELVRNSTRDVISDPVGSPNRLLYLTPPSLLAGTPTGTSISRSDGRKTISVRWSAPASTGGATITGYRVIRTGSADAAKKRVVVANLSAGATSHTFGSLVAGGSYAVRIVPITANGPGNGAYLSTKLLAVPGQPKIKKASSGSTKSAGTTVTGRWSKPTSGGAVVSYQITADRVGSSKDKTVTAPASATSVTITGLAKNKKYRITVRGVNVAGGGAWSAKSGKVTAK